MKNIVIDLPQIQGTIISVYAYHAFDDYRRSPFCHVDRFAWIVIFGARRKTVILIFRLNDWKCCIKYIFSALYVRFDVVLDVVFSYIHSFVENSSYFPLFGIYSRSQLLLVLCAGDTKIH